MVKNECQDCAADGLAGRARLGSGGRGPGRSCSRLRGQADVCINPNGPAARVKKASLKSRRTLGWWEMPLRASCPTSSLLGAEKRAGIRPRDTGLAILSLRRPSIIPP
jgi:hypothetical protein